MEQQPIDQAADLQLRRRAVRLAAFIRAHDARATVMADATIVVAGLCTVRGGYPCSTIERLQPTASAVRNWLGY